ncbi:MAG: 4Fe-4S binding protein [Planctomycetes bacterium]|nr:4Fe-4S binding protein [Planctomycetota bacterium]
MTISVYDYFKIRKSDRKKETRYLAVINKDSCTSCNACATQCPVDCIYEVPSSTPSDSFHQIDTSRCIGCQLCYRIPTESTEHYTLEICPWNAIDMLHNPNVQPSESPLVPYYQGDEAGDQLPWQKLDEYAYQLFLDGEVFLPSSEPALIEIVGRFEQPVWYYDEGQKVQLVRETSRTGDYVRYGATPEGRDVLDVVFQDWDRIFLD